jgi:hypothetical protein
VDAAVLVGRAGHRGLVVHDAAAVEARCGAACAEPARGVAGGYLHKNYAAMAEYAANGNIQTGT